MTSGHRYHPYYCEENIWWLAQDPALAELPRWVVFVSNDVKQVPMWQQRAAGAGEHVVWDYHCLLVTESPNGAEVWDLDSRLATPTRLTDYLAHTFAPLPPEVAQHTPRFRIVGADEFLASFSSDRSHMRTASGWLKPPPPWDPPTIAGQTTNLMRFVDMRDTIKGEVLDVAGLRARFAP